MKKSIHSVLPALALLTLGGCAGTSALTTTESDGVYFSSKDRVTAPIASQSATDASGQTDANGDVANPDYAGNSNSSTSGSTEYYDDDYSYASRLRRFHQPSYRGLGMGYYDFAYTDPFWYGGPAYSYYPGVYSRFGSPFYDPFYSPYWGGGSYISISFGRPWYRPFGYGYSPYDAYGYGYGGYGGYGYGGFGGGYYNGYLNGYSNGVGSGYYDRNTRNRTVYAPRRDGATEASQATSTATSGGIRGQVQQNGVLAPSTGSNGVVSSAPEQPIRGRGRVDERQAANQAPASSSTQGVVTENGTGRTGRVLATDQAQPNLNPGGGRRWRVLEEASTQPGSQSASQPSSAPADYSQPRRGRGWNNDAQPAQQQVGSAEQPARRERAWQQSTRTFDQSTQPSRSYEQPTRSYEPSRSSSPSNGGSFGGGGGNSGGSRGRGRVE